MFYDLTQKKTMPLMLLALVFVLGLSMFFYFGIAGKGVDRAFQLMDRVRSSFLFSLFYNPPWGQQVASVAMAHQDGTARAVPVLLYHGTPPEGNSNPPLPQSVFVDQLRALKADGWQTVTMKQFTDFMKSGAPIPKKSFLLTFDDGRKESFYPVDPVLKELGYNAVMFVVTGFSLPASDAKTSYYLSRTELQYMEDSGRWEIESHGAEDHRLYDVPAQGTSSVDTIKSEHFLSNKFWLTGPGRIETAAEYTDRITNDLTASKKLLEQDFGKPVVAFAFPFNDYGQATANFPGSRDILADVVPSIYTFAFYQVNALRDDPFNYYDRTASFIKRIEPTADWSGQYLAALLDGSDAKELPYSSNGFSNEWNSNWGDAHVEHGTLMLRAATTTTGAASLLHGSYWWQDYAASTSLRWNNADSVSLIARYQSDSKTFLTCAFEKDRIVLQGHVGGKTSTLASAEYTPDLAASLELAMSARGTEVSCTGAGAAVEKSVDQSFVHPGSAGVQAWGQALGVESVDVSKFSARDTI